MKKIFFFLAFIIGSANYLIGQNVTNVKYSHHGQTVTVTYNLNIPPDSEIETALFISTNSGKSFRGPLKEVNGDVGILNSGGLKTLTWHIFEDYKGLQGDVVFDVRAGKRGSFVKKTMALSYTLSGSSAFGITYAKLADWGWYLRVKSNGFYTVSNYVTNNERITNYDGDGYYIFTDNVKRSRLGVTGGFVRKAAPDLFFYLGMGYGARILMWNAEEFSYLNNRKIKNIWAEHTDRTFKGTELELGLFYKIKNLNFSIGINTIDFKFLEPHAGIGFNL